MTRRPRIALIHATRVAMAPIEAAFARHWPEAETISLLDEGLSADLEAGRAARQDIDTRIVALGHHVLQGGPDGVLYSCSSFGSGIEQAARLLPVPVAKPNAAMFDEALRRGGRVAMLYTFAPAAEAMAREFRQMAVADGSAAVLDCILVPDALAALAAGDGATHDALVAQAAAGLGPAATVLLAQFSMARAADAVRAVVDVPVLTSPESAVLALRARVTQGMERVC